jgi:hypothetical protein
MHAIRQTASLRGFTLAVFLTALAVHPAPAAPNPVLVKYSMTNPDATKPASDLELTFNSTVNSKGSKSVTWGDGQANVNTMEFGGAKFVAAGATDTGVVSVNPLKGTNMLTLTMAAFSYPVGANQPAKNPMPALGVAIGKMDDGTVIITNEDTSTLYFSSVTASTDLASSNFTDTSDAQLDNLTSNNLYATGFVADFSLSPGATLVMDLGPLSQTDDYTAVSFTVDYSASPSAGAIQLAFAGNNEIPEPATIALVAVSLLGLSSLIRRRSDH